MLDRILEATRRSLDERKARAPLTVLEAAASEQAPARDFVRALRGRDGVNLIAEVKRASPSRGLLCPGLSAALLARTYSDSGAAAISVLTEERYFLGGLADLAEARATVDLPLLRKDFIVDPYQVYEARAHGADAVLLIAAILSDIELGLLNNLAGSLGMAALIEAHNEIELQRALEQQPRIIGINNRNLSDFSVEIGTTLSLRPMIPPDIVVASESGIHTRDDVVALERAGIDAILVGEALVTSPDPAQKIRELLGYAKPTAA